MGLPRSALGRHGCQVPERTSGPGRAPGAREEPWNLVWRRSMDLFRKLWRKRSSRRSSQPPRARLEVEALESRLVPYTTSGNAWIHPELVTLSFVPDGTIVGSNASGPIASDLFATFDAKFGSG